MRGGLLLPESWIALAKRSDCVYAAPDCEIRAHECQMAMQCPECHAAERPCSVGVVSRLLGSISSKTPRRLSFGCALRAVLTLGMVLNTSGCRREEDAPNPSQTADAATQLQNDELAAAQPNTFQNLAALGYLDYSPEVADKSRNGVVRNDQERSSPGYNLYSNRVLSSAVLIDEKGKVIHEWEHQEPGNWNNCELLPNGDLLVPGRADNRDLDAEQNRYLLRLSWDGHVIWKRDISAHHDVEVTPRDQILTLGRHAIKRKGLRDNQLMLMSHQDGIIEELSLYKVTRGRPDILKLQFDGVKKTERGIVDLFHANSIEWMYHEHLESKHPIYSPSNIIVSIRHQNAVVIIDWDAKELVWAWGPGEILGPHDASVLKNGHILIFDNGLGRGWSRVIELDPLARRIVWEYKAPTPTDFYTGTRGGCQRLPNDNTLITDSEAGRVFEVTPDGEIVWEFLSPHLNEEGHRATIVRMKRYERAYIDRILRAHRAAEAPPTP